MDRFAALEESPGILVREGNATLRDDGPSRGYFRGVIDRMFGINVPFCPIESDDESSQTSQSYTNVDTDSDDETETDVPQSDSEKDNNSRDEEGEEDESYGSVGSDETAVEQDDTLSRHETSDHEDEGNAGRTNNGDEEQDEDGEKEADEENKERDESEQEHSEQESDTEDEDESPEMEEHFKFVERYRESLGGKPRPFSLDNAVGKYIVYSDYIEEQYGSRDEGKPYEIRIFNPHDDTDRLVGLFDFGILEGVMRIGTDPEILKGKWRGDEDDEEDIDEEDEGTDEDYDDTEAPVTSTKRKAATDLSNTDTKKRRHSASLGIKNRGVHFLWRGRETGEGEIQLDFDNTVNVGHITFEDDACLTFSGLIDADLLGKGIEFNGYKVSDNGGRMNKTWAEYSEKRHGYESVARWG